MENQLIETQTRFLKIFEGNEDGGELDITCDMIGIPKEFVKEWLEDYSPFWEKLEDLKDEKKANLADKVMKGDVQASMKFLKIYAKDRGY